MFSAEIQRMMVDGFVVISSVLPASLVDRVVKDIELYRSLHPEEKKDEYGRGRRLGLAHLEIPSLMECITHQSILEFVRQRFSGQPALMGSLQFDYGSEQPLHNDAHFICTRNPDQMQSVWIALEDVKDDAGPVLIYPKTHLKPFMPYDTLLKHPDLKKEVFEKRDVLKGKEYYDLINKVFFTWVNDQREIIKREKIEPFIATIKKGDVLFFHPHVMHEGAPIKDPKRFRRSVVGHFFLDKSPVWNRNHCILNGESFEDEKALELTFSKGPVPYVEHPGPVFKHE